MKAEICFAHRDVKLLYSFELSYSMHHLSCIKLFLVNAAVSFLCCGFIRAINLTDVAFLTCMR